MPRGPRLDAPGALHHVIARGIEQGAIFQDDFDRENLLRRLQRLVMRRWVTVYAWALMPNHFHVLLRTGEEPLSRSMRSLLSGYATWFNRRHRRAGHLFQNRYRSTLCEEDAYFFALVRYIHRNPVPTVVPHAEALVGYPYTGHSAIVGRHRREWQDVDAVLGRFAVKRAEAIDRYLRFVTESDDGIDLEGGGLRRTRDCWERMNAIEKGRERFIPDERILGSDPFVEHIRSQLPRARRASIELGEVVHRVCQRVGIQPTAIRGTGRSRKLTRAREGVAFIWTVVLGQSCQELAQSLGLAASSIREASRRGAADSEEWNQALYFSPAPESLRD